MLRSGKGVGHSTSSISLTAVLLALVLSPSLSYSTTRYVANNGVDSGTCGTSTGPCRSITQAMANAVAGDTIIVGPGVYGDLNGDGTLGNSAGEENPSGCSCMLAIVKRVILISSDGAASTIIDARGVELALNVGISANGVQFGTPGQGSQLPARSRHLTGRLKPSE